MNFFRRKYFRPISGRNSAGNWWHWWKYRSKNRPNHGSIKWPGGCHFEVLDLHIWGERTSIHHFHPPQTVGPYMQPTFHNRHVKFAEIAFFGHFWPILWRILHKIGQKWPKKAISANLTCRLWNVGCIYGPTVWGGWKWCIEVRSPQIWRSNTSKWHPPGHLMLPWFGRFLDLYFHQCHQFPAEFRPEIGRKYFLRKKFTKLIRKHIYTFFISHVVFSLSYFLYMRVVKPNPQITSFIFKQEVVRKVSNSYQRPWWFRPYHRSPG